MSTKIYNGFALPSIKTLVDMQSFIMSMREECGPIATGIILKRMGYQVVRVLDAFHLYFDHDREQYVREMRAILDIADDKEQTEFLVNATPYTVVVRYCKEQIRKAKDSPYRGEGLDVRFELMFFPTGNKLLGIPYTEPQEYMDCLSKQPEYQYYGYWDNVDPDEDCSEEEWEQRKNDWTNTTLLEGSGVPSEHGFSAVIVEQQMPLHFMYDRGEIYPQLMEVIDSLESVEARAHTHTLSRITRRLVNEMDTSEWMSKSFADAYEIHRDVRKNWETKYKDEYDVIFAEVLSHLPETYTVDDIITKWEHPDDHD